MKLSTMREINPKETTRAYAFELWMKAPMPMVTFFKILDVSRLVKISKKSGMKFNMLMCWCIGKAASSIKEFYMLPVGEKFQLANVKDVMGDNSSTRSSSSGNGFGSFGSVSNSSSQDFNRRLFMKKLLIIYLIISFLMVFVYAIFVVNAYVSIKYEVETIDNDAIINMVYQIFDTGVTINFIWFAINTIIILGLYIKLRRK